MIIKYVQPFDFAVFDKSLNVLQRQRSPSWKPA